MRVIFEVQNDDLVAQKTIWAMPVGDHKLYLAIIVCLTNLDSWPESRESRACFLAFSRCIY